jgi:hypothetical protein
VKALASSLASVLRRRRGCLLPFWRLAFIVCTSKFVHWIHIHVDDSDCPKGAFLICCFGLKGVRSSVALEDLQGRAF